MLSRLLFVFLVSFASSASGQNQPEPDEKQDESGGRSREERQDDRRERRGGEGREGRGRDRVRGDRDRWERFRNATPEERERMRADRLVEMAGRTYELTDEQRTLVKGEIEKMGEERKALMGADYDRYQQLREQMFSYWRDRSANEGEGRPDWRAMRNNPEFQKLREELRSLEQKYPLDWDASMRRVESLLPPEQAAKGREAFESRRTRWQGRRERREAEAREVVQEAISESEKALAEGKREKAREALDRAARRAERGGMSDEVRGELQNRVTETRQRLGIDAPEVRVAEEHAWEKEAREFAAKHDFSPVQQSAVQAILKDVRSRAAQIEVANAPQIAAAEQITDVKEREAKQKELKAPIEELHAELKVRLDRLLTAEQRKKAGS